MEIAWINKRVNDEALQASQNLTTQFNSQLLSDN